MSNMGFYAQRILQPGVPPPTPGAEGWYLGPMNNGLDLVYRYSADPAEFSGADIIIPDLGDGTGFNRMQSVNGALFLYSTNIVSVNTIVSFNRGTTWTRCNMDFVRSTNVATRMYHTGTHYIYGDIRSTDGVTWEAMPFLAPIIGGPGNVTDSFVKQGTSTLFVTLGSGYGTYRSTDSGTTAVARAYPDVAWGAAASDGSRIVYYSAYSGGVYSDDEIDSIVSCTGTPPNSAAGLLYHPAAGIWLGNRTGVGISSATNGIAWTSRKTGLVVDGQALEFDGYAYAAVETPSATTVRPVYSYNGTTWINGTTISYPSGSTLTPSICYLSDAALVGAPPSAFGGLTFWYDGDNSPHYQGDTSASTLANADGQPVCRYDSHNGIARVVAGTGGGQFAIRRLSPGRVQFTGAEPANAEVWVKPAPGAGAALGTPATLGDLISVSNAGIVMLIRVNSAPSAAANVYDNTMTFGDRDRYLSSYFHDSAGNPYFGILNYDGSYDEVGAVSPGSMGQWVVVTTMHRAGQLRVRINGVEVASGPSGNTQLLTPQALMGYLWNGAANFEIAQEASFNVSHTDVEYLQIEKFFGNKAGLSI